MLLDGWEELQARYRRNVLKRQPSGLGLTATKFNGRTAAVLQWFICVEVEH